MTAKVEWAPCAMDDYSHNAHVEHLTLFAGHEGWWRVECHGRMLFHGLEIAKPTLESAQAAAISAATGLLVEALAGVPVTGAMASRVTLLPIPGCGTVVNVVTCMTHDPADAIALGHALIAAGVAARGGG